MVWGGELVGKLRFHFTARCSLLFEFVFFDQAISFIEAKQVPALHHMGWQRCGYIQNGHIGIGMRDLNASCVQMQAPPCTASPDGLLKTRTFLSS